MPVGTYVRLPSDLKAKLVLIGKTGKPIMSLRSVIVTACEEYCDKILAGIPDIDITIERITEAKKGAGTDMSLEDAGLRE